MAYDLTDLVTVEQAKLAAQKSRQDVQALDNKINNTLTSVYKIKGSLASSALVASLLVAANEGNVYNITDDFTTTADFVEGAGKKHTAGTNIVIANTGTSETPVYKFDVHAGDLSNVQTLVPSATNGNLAGLDATGQSTDSGVAAVDVVTKIAGAAENNIVVFSSDGKMKNSGIQVASNTEFNEMLAEVYGE